MKKHSEKILSVLLTVLFVLTMIPFTAVYPALAAPQYNVGDVIEFGAYPQTRVTDSATISRLNSKSSSLEWTSYGYYSDEDGYGSKPGDWMTYCDIYCNGERYRGVKTTKYRPYMTSVKCGYGTNNQHDNGYTTSTKYWFKWEPLKWTVIDPNAGIVLCKSVIDSQPIINIVYAGANFVNYNDEARTHYASDYKTSFIRQWLSETFFSAAFSSTEQSKLKTVTLDNSCPRRPEYSGESSSDKIYLLSLADTLNDAYGFSTSDGEDGSRIAYRTDYAAIQGVGSLEDGRAGWITRTPRESNSVEYVRVDGSYTYVFANQTAGGVRPAFTFRSGISESHYAVNCSHAETVFTGNDDGTHFKRCASCDLVLETLPHRAGNDGVSSANAEAHYIRCLDCGVSFWQNHTSEMEVLASTTRGNCVDQSINYYKCSICGRQTRSENAGLVPDNHKGPFNTQAAVTPTCTVSGSTAGSFCRACNNWATAPQSVGTDPENHVNTITVPATDSTCRSHGYTEGVYCNDCETYISGHEEKPLAGHTWDDGVEVQAATCSAMGKTKYTCTVEGCGAEQTLTDIPVDEDNHADTVDTPETYSTCRTHGYTAGVYCNDCETYISGHEEKPFAGHAWDDGVEVQAATCSAMGKTKYTCTVEGCGAEQTLTDIPVNENNHLNTVDTPETYSTCHSHGYTAGVYCNDCETYISGHEEKDLLAHPWDEGVVTTEPDCSHTGIRLHHCTAEDCGETWEEILGVDFSAHVFEVSDVAPTCTEDGYTLHKCTKCDYSYKDNIIPTSGHDEVLSPFVPQTCTGNGHTEFTYCSVCGELLSGEDRVLPWIGHNYGAPSDLGDGTHGEVCTKCGDVRNIGEHNWDAGVATAMPTCVSAGEAIFTCIDCGLQRTEPLTDENAHKWGDWVFNAETKTHSRFCELCSAPDALSGDVDCDCDTFELREPTLSEDGERLFVCKICGGSWSEYYSATGINFEFPNIILTEGDETQLNVYIQPQNRIVADPLDISVISGEDCVSIFDNSITAVSEGTAVIKAESENGLYTAYCSVVVRPAPEVKYIVISSDGVSVSNVPGTSLYLDAVIVPGNLTVDDLIWTSSNPDAVSVDAGGLLTYYAVGEAVITAESPDGSAKGSIKVTTVEDESLIEDDVETFSVLYVNNNSGYVINGVNYTRDLSITYPAGEDVTFRTIKDCTVLANGARLEANGDGSYTIWGIDRDYVIMTSDSEGAGYSEDDPGYTDPGDDEPSASDVCAYCGQTHNGTLGIFIRFIHSIMYVFKTMFK